MLPRKRGIYLEKDREWGDPFREREREKNLLGASESKDSIWSKRENQDPSKVEREKKDNQNLAIVEGKISENHWQKQRERGIAAERKRMNE